MSITREEWLNKMAEHLQVRFAIKGFIFERQYRISCGLPSKGAFNKCGRVVGECWASGASKDGANEIFISPTQDDSNEVVGILCHEMIHAWDDCKNGHRKTFSQCSKAMGLEGKPTSTVVGKELASYINLGIDRMGIGEYPHQEMDYTPKKKQSTRLLKIECINDNCAVLDEQDNCYSVRMSRTMLDLGSPLCGCCGFEMHEELKQEA